MTKYLVVRFTKNGNVESDNQYFKTYKEAEEHLNYTLMMLTDSEKNSYSDISIIEEEEEE